MQYLKALMIFTFFVAQHAAVANDEITKIQSDWKELADKLHAIPKDQLLAEACARFQFAALSRNDIRTLEFAEDDFAHVYAEEQRWPHDFRKDYAFDIEHLLFKGCLSELVVNGSIDKKFQAKFKKTLFAAADKAKRIIRIRKTQDDAYIFVHYIFYLGYEANDPRISVSVGYTN